MIKRMMSFILAVALLFGVGYSNAEMVSNSLLEVQDGSLAWEFCFYKGDIYTMYKDEAIMKFNAETNKFEAVALLKSSEDDLLNYNHAALVSDGEKLYLLSSKEFAEVSIDGDKVKSNPIMKFESGEMDNIFDPVMNNGKLYQKSYNEENGRPGFKIVDIAAKTIDEIYFDGYVSSFGAYKDSIFILNENNEICVLEGKEFKKIHELKEDEPSRYILYDQNTDIFYCVAYNGVLNKIGADNEITPVALMPEDIDKVYMVEDSKIAYLTNGQTDYSKVIGFIDLKNAKMPEKTLNILGCYTPSILKKYNSTHSDMPAVSMEGNIYDITKIADQMKSDNKPDVIFMELQNGVNNLIKHDYAESIKDPALLEKIGRMYPYITDAISENGEYFVFPYNVYSYNSESAIQNYAYNTEAWSRLGLSESDVPKNYAEFIQFIDKYQAELSQPDIELFSYMSSKDIRTELKIRLLNEAVLYAQTRGEMPNFNTPEMQQLFAMIDNAKFEGFFDRNNPDMDYVQETDEKTELFKSTEDIMDIPNGYALMPLKFKDSEESHTVANMTVMLVNSLSENKDKAFEFINSVADNFSQRTQTYMYSDVNETVINKNMEISIEYTQKRIDKLEKKINEMKASNDKGVSALEQELDYMKKDLEYFKKNNYIINQEELDALQNNANNIIIQKNAAIKSDNEQMIKLLDEYYDKDSKLSSQQFLSELDRISKMSMLEGN